MLIVGETGVGKEVLAEIIHGLSPRAGKPFVRINCATLSSSLFEAELFGHERGAFTDAREAKPGLLETAEGGTVMLDEIGELPLPLQAKLLRVIETREVMRVGAVKARTIDVRFLAATNRVLEDEVARGAFRQDLYYRLNGISLLIPPLRARVDEIEPLARCVRRERREAVRAPAGRSCRRRPMKLLLPYAWPGNIRELRNTIERALLLSTGDSITPEDLPLEKMRGTPMSMERVPEAAPRAAQYVRGRRASTTPSRLDYERIVESLSLCSGNQTRAAKLLGMSRRTFCARLKAYNIPRPRVSGEFFRRRELDHPQHRARRARADVVGDGDPLLGRLVAQRAVDALEIGRLHVLAQAARLVELLLGVLELQAHDQPALGQDRVARLLGVGLDVLRHLRRRQHGVGRALQLGPHLAVHDHGRLRIVAADARDVVDGHLVVDVAGALPGEHVADQPLALALPDQRLDHLGVFARVELVRLGRRQVHPLGVQRDLVGEVLVGDEQQVGDAQLVRDARRVRAGAAGVGQRLHVGVGVHVGHRREPAPRRAQELLPLGDVVGVDLGQRAERLQVGQIDRPLGRQRVAALGHEAHAAEHDQVRRRCRARAPPARSCHRRCRRSPGPRAPGSCAPGRRRACRA